MAATFVKKTRKKVSGRGKETALKPLTPNFFMPAIRKPKRFRILEAGPGELKATAWRALKKRSVNREFTLVDLSNLLHFERISSGLHKKIKIVQSDAVKGLGRTPKNSQHIIFSSFLMNNMPKEKQASFMEKAKDALMPGGRLILVMEKMSLLFPKTIPDSPEIDYAKTAKKLGLGFHTIAIPDKTSSNSHAPGIRGRSTTSKRMRVFKEYKKRGGPVETIFQKLKASGEVKTRQELITPTMVIIQKPRKPKARKQL